MRAILYMQYISVKYFFTETYKYFSGTIWTSIKGGSFMQLVFRGSLQFFSNKKDISIISYQVANFFKVQHEKRLLPMIGDIFKSSENGFKQVKGWSAWRKKSYVSHYRLNKEGCIIICESLKPEKFLKKEFLTLTEVLE